MTGGPTPIRPEGRWHRILRAVETRPLRMSEILRAARSPTIAAPKADKVKIWRAINTLADTGLITHTPGGFIATRNGREALMEAAGG